MATDIPPHNAREGGRCTAGADRQAVSVSRRGDGVYPPPDYPTEVEIITGPEDIRKIYKSGRGSARMRAVWTTEDGNAVITALPHQVSGAKVLEQIAAQMRAKNCRWWKIHESDHENPTRLVVVPRSNRIDLDQVMTHLFATTDLERSYRINLNMIGLDGRPAVKGWLRSSMSGWFTAANNCRRLESPAGKVLRRLHILDGLLLAYLNIDEVIGNHPFGR